MVSCRATVAASALTLLALSADAFAWSGLHPSTQPCLFRTSWNPRTVEGHHEDEVLKHGLEHMFADYQFRHLNAIPVPMPSVVTAPSGQEVVVCLNRKVGSTRWKHLFLKATGWNPDPDDFRTMNHALYVDDDENWDAVNLWNNINTPADYADRLMKFDGMSSFIFVRSPYTRLLSGFFDKVAPARAAGCQGFTYDEIMGNCPEVNQFKHAFDNYEFSTEAFETFVKDLYSIHQSEGLAVVDSHIMPLTMQCGIEHGLQYDFIMKLEEEAIWYPEWIKLLGMEETAASGWAKYSHTEVFDPERDCFYHPDWMTCAQMNQTVHEAGRGKECALGAGGKILVRGSSASSKNENAEHHTGADSMVLKYFTPQMVAMATEMLQKDIDLFGYEVLDPKAVYPY